MTTPYRVLVTGSRSWRWPTVVHTRLDTAATRGGPLVVIHGAASGVDSIADRHAHDRRWAVQAWPADWTGPCCHTCQPGHRRRAANGRRYCPTAGHRRNQAMVDVGADVCVAFIRDHSRGATDCARRARAAGIEVVEVFDCACHPINQPSIDHGGVLF